MSDYKHTLNLPQTSFPMKANLVKRELEQALLWESMDLWTQIERVQALRGVFVLHDGPPYANGHLHCGHALNKILKDIVLKSKAMSGYRTYFKPGWDCHGLPIELNVEKKKGKPTDAESQKQFREHCRSYASTQIEVQRQEFKRLGVFADWSHPYLTMDFHYEATAVRALAQLLRGGHLTRGFKPVHWCIDCGSALAEAELDYADKKSEAIDVAFWVVDPEHFTEGQMSISKPIALPTWTTTPWTLPANEAVCLHPESLYVLVDVGAYGLLVAAALKDEVLLRYGLTEQALIFEAAGAQFAGKQLQHPLYPKQVPVLCGAHVTMDAGTGAVHTAPAFGPEDYQIGVQYQLPLDHIVMGNGCYRPDLPLFGGQSVLKVNAVIIAALADSGHLLHHQTIEHSYPHCWRHKSPTLFRATPQWFISMDQAGLRQQVLDLLPQISWLPEWGQQRMRDMISKRPDWCISRQRSWGTPLTLFIHKETGALHPDSLALMERIALEMETRGIELWFETDAVYWLGVDAEQYDKINDTVDVWFDSGISHQAVLSQTNLALRFPADVYFEGSDQYRGWFSSALITAVAITGQAPFKAVLTHGYTVDAQGKKLSKSQGNYVALDQLIQKHGADVIRLWVASTDYRAEVSVSDEIIERAADAYWRIRNTARFLLANLFDFDPSQHQIPSTDWLEIDRYMLQRCQQLQDEIVAAYAEYQFHVIYQKIHHFCTLDLGAFYLDIIKDRQYTMAAASSGRRACQTVMYHILQALTRWLAPILTFTADEIWCALPQPSGPSVFLTTWHVDWPQMQAAVQHDWQWLQLLRDEVNKALELKRQAGDLGSGLAATVQLYAQADSPTAAVLTTIGKELRFIFITSGVEILDKSLCPPDVAWIPTLDLGLEVKPCEAVKCARCWHRVDDVGQNSEFTDLCLRCVATIQDQDEVRRFA